MNVHVFLEYFPLGFTTYSFIDNISQLFFRDYHRIDKYNYIINAYKKNKGKTFLQFLLLRKLDQPFK